MSLIDLENLVDQARSLAEPLPQRRIDRIIRTVAAETGYTVGEITGGQRRASLCQARFMAMWLTSKTTGYTLKRIAGPFANRDHTSVLHALRRFEAERARDPKIKALSDRLLGELSS
jgi:chromosomal replication initiator protein